MKRLFQDSEYENGYGLQLKKHQGLVPVSHKNIIYRAVGKEQTAKGGVLYGGKSDFPTICSF